MVDTSSTYTITSLMGEGSVWFKASSQITYNPGVSLVGTTPAGKTITVTLPTYMGYTITVVTTQTSSLTATITTNSTSAGCIQASGS